MAVGYGYCFLLGVQSGDATYSSDPIHDVCVCSYLGAYLMSNQSSLAHVEVCTIRSDDTSGACAYHRYRSLSTCRCASTSCSLQTHTRFGAAQYHLTLGDHLPELPEATQDDAAPVAIRNPTSMRGILPGRPQAKLQAVAHGLWEGTQIIVRRLRPSTLNTIVTDR